jgi:hypothetical protein
MLTIITPQGELSLGQPISGEPDCDDCGRSPAVMHVLAGAEDARLCRSCAEKRLVVGAG